MIKVKCSKCENGVIKAFSHIQGGVCFTCGGRGYFEAKKQPAQTKVFTFSFLWIDEKDPNYNNGVFCQCFTKNAKSAKQAEQIAKKSMEKNGSVAFKIEEKFA